MINEKTPIIARVANTTTLDNSLGKDIDDNKYSVVLLMIMSEL